MMKRYGAVAARGTWKAAAALGFILMLSSCELLGSILGEDDDDGTQVFAEDALGRGYNILGSYADSKEVRAQVLDFQRLLDEGLIDERVVERATFQTFFGTTVEEFTSSMEAYANVSGEYKGFSGSLDTNFSSNEYQRAEYSYASVQNEVFKRSLNVDTRRTETLRGYLTERASEELNDPSVSPAAIFSRYGSHVLLGIYVGGRLDYNMATDVSQVESEQSINIVAQASFDNAFVSAEAETGFSYDERVADYESHSSITVNVYGGASEFGQAVLTDSNYTPWVESIEGRQIFVGFLSGQQPLLPIWEFVDGAGRKNEIREAFLKIAGEDAENFTEQPMRVEITLDRFSATGIHDEVGGGGSIELFGVIRAKGWPKVDNSVNPPRTSGTPFEIDLWTVEAENHFSLDGSEDGRSPRQEIRRTVIIPNFDENFSAIELIADLKERDFPAADPDDELPDANRYFYLRDGFRSQRGGKTLTVIDNLNMQITMSFTFDILR